MKRYAKVYALGFKYGQKHEKEVDVARRIAQDAGIEYHLIDASFISTLASNSLTSPDIKMDEQQPEGGVPNTFVPGRNLFFLSIAAVFAREKA